MYLSNAQQSCVPATAPRTHVIKQQNDGDAMKKINEKINQKSIQNQSKIDQISIKNHPKSRSGGVLEASWGVLEAFWGVLGGLEPS